MSELECDKLLKRLVLRALLTGVKAEQLRALVHKFNSDNGWVIICEYSSMPEFLFALSMRALVGVPENVWQVMLRETTA